MSIRSNNCYKLAITFQRGFDVVTGKKIETGEVTDNGGNVGGKDGGDVTRLSQALSQVVLQVCPKLDVSHYPDAIAILIALYKGPQSLKELMEQTKEKNRGRIKENVLQHLCGVSFVEPTIKDVPNSPKQKYALTDKGRKQIQAMT